jgi:hypothetical protein
MVKTVVLAIWYSLLIEIGCFIGWMSGVGERMFAWIHAPTLWFVGFFFRESSGREQIYEFVILAILTQWALLTFLFLTVAHLKNCIRTRRNTPTPSTPR